MPNRIDHNRANRVSAGRQAASENLRDGPFRAGPSPWAPAKQIKRCAELAERLGIDPPAPKPPATRVTKRDAGRFIDSCLMQLAKGGKA